ncbi:amino acid adenylation domain-containing protein [Actinopolyspora lacussalsi]|nr:amino acid adenylation domain-containing protein [Actinopolyspora lacussalsi]
MVGTGSSDYHEAELTHEAFEAVVRRQPDRLAVTEPGSGSLTYAELDARARRLAGRLVADGIEAGELVGLCLPRGIDLVVGVVAVLKAGGAYVPLDPELPAARTELLLTDTQVRTVVTDDAGAELLADQRVSTVPVDPPEPTGATDPPRPREDDPAYVIHTSGSTGTPKGVVVEHRNVLRLFETTDRLLDLGPDDVWTMFHSVSFDFSVWEIWGALLHGARLVVVPRDVTRVPERVLALLREERVTVLSQTPSAFRALTAAAERGGGDDELELRYVVFGGERLDLSALRGWLERHGDTEPELINMYGITETTVHVTYRRIRVADLRTPDRSPIGVPLPDLRVRLVDGEGREVPTGTAGEIQVNGPGVARGYLRRPELTAERFVTDAEGRWYASGDRAVRRPDGDLIYLGRVDDQIKVRGYRIEPGEVEHCLEEQDGVAAVVVAPRDYDGDRRLVAYVLPSEHTAAEPLFRRLSGAARERLPTHMRPAVYRVITELPLTEQGKTDRDALDSFVSHESASEAPDEAPDEGADESTTETTEQLVSRIVGKVLERPDVDSDDDLFAAGATSLSLMRIIAELRRESGARVDIDAIGEHASIRRLAFALSA